MGWPERTIIAGAGPVGLTAVIDLGRRGIGVRVVDPLVEPPLYAKAVGGIAPHPGRRCRDERSDRLRQRPGRRAHRCEPARRRAHSVVRNTLGLSFEGAAFEEQYMLGDVETDGTTDDLLVCIPLPGRGRYRMSMLVPAELASDDGVTHGFSAGTKPEPTVARNLRWSSVFPSADRYAGDEHRHPGRPQPGLEAGVSMSLR